MQNLTPRAARGCGEPASVLLHACRPLLRLLLLVSLARRCPRHWRLAPPSPPPLPVWCVELLTITHVARIFCIDAHLLLQYFCQYDQHISSCNRPDACHFEERYSQSALQK